MTQTDELKDVVAYLRQRAEMTEDAERQKKLKAMADQLENSEEQPGKTIVAAARHV